MGKKTPVKIGRKPKTTPTVVKKKAASRKVRPRDTSIPRFNWAQERTANSLYQKLDIPVDSLAYTKEFHEMCDTFNEKTDPPEGSANWSRRVILRNLQRLRKTGRLKPLDTPTT